MSDIVEATNSDKFPTLTLPSSAVNNEILDLIEQCVLSVHENRVGDFDGSRPNDQEDLNEYSRRTSKILNDIQIMRDYINGQDGRKFSL